MLSTVVLGKSTCKEFFGNKEIKPVHPQGNQSWIFIGKTDVEAETPILWPPHAKSWLIWKDPDAGKDWGQEEKGTTEDEMAGWHHRLNGCESGWTPGVCDGQGVLACCNSWGRKESDTTERLNWTELKITETKRLVKEGSHFNPGVQSYIFKVLVFGKRRGWWGVTREDAESFSDSQYLTWGTKWQHGRPEDMWAFCQASRNTRWENLLKYHTC